MPSGSPDTPIEFILIFYLAISLICFTLLSILKPGKTVFAARSVVSLSTLREKRALHAGGQACWHQSALLRRKGLTLISAAIPPYPTQRSWHLQVIVVATSVICQVLSEFCDRNRRDRLLKKQPVQTLYGFSNQIVPRACFPDGIRVSNLPICGTVEILEWNGGNGNYCTRYCTDFGTSRPDRFI